MKRGFTLIELLIVIVIFIIIGGIAVVNLAQRRVDTDLVATTQQVATLLRQAQSDSMAQENGLSWGVHFSNSTSVHPFYALFSGSYATGTKSGYYPLPSTVAYQTSTLASGGTFDVIFSQIVGVTTSTSIGLYMPNENSAFSSTISVASSGAVTY